jgi:hypothetical protein
MIPSLPCDITDISCWKNLTIDKAKENSDRAQDKIKEAKDFVD